MARSRCPACSALPHGARWRCDACGDQHDALITEGACPRCALAWLDIVCPDCGAWSPLEEWLIEPEARAAWLRRLDEAEGLVRPAWSGSGERPKAASLERRRGEVLRLEDEADAAARAGDARLADGLRRQLEEARRLCVAAQRARTHLTRRVAASPGGAPWRAVKLTAPREHAPGPAPGEVTAPAALEALARRIGIGERQVASAYQAVLATADKARRAAVDLFDHVQSLQARSQLDPDDARCKLTVADEGLARCATQSAPWTSRATVRYQVGDHQGARADAGEALRQARTPAERAAALRIRSLARTCLGDHAGALGDIDAAIAAVPDSAWSHQRRGSVLQDLGDDEGCVAACGRALQLDPDPEHPWLVRGLSQRDPGAALADLGEVIRRKPDVASHWASRALCFVDAGRLDEARIDVARALRLRPHDPMARLAEAHVSDRSGDGDAAMRAIDRSVRLCPTDFGTPWRVRAAGHLSRGDPERALLDVTAAVRASPQDHDSRLLRGEILLLLGDTAGASEELEQAARAPGDTGVYARLWSTLRFGRRLEGPPSRHAWVQDVVETLAAGTTDLEPLKRRIGEECAWDGNRPWRTAWVELLAAVRADGVGAAEAAVAHARAAAAADEPLLSGTGGWARSRLRVSDRAHAAAKARLAPTIPPPFVPGSSAPIRALAPGVDLTPSGAVRVSAHADGPGLRTKARSRPDHGDEATETLLPPSGPVVIAGTPLAPASPPAPPTAAAGPSIVDQLERLAALRAQGILTDEELRLAKRRLLGLG